MTLDLRQNFVSTKYLENQLIDFTKFYMCIRRQHVGWNLYLSFMAHWLQRYVLELYRGSYMSAHVLLNLLNELGKRDKMRGLPSILSLFCNEFNKFNNTRARMLDSFYHMIKSHFC